MVHWARRTWRGVRTCRWVDIQVAGETVQVDAGPYEGRVAMRASSTQLRLT